MEAESNQIKKEEWAPPIPPGSRLVVQDGIPGGIAFTTGDRVRVSDLRESVGEDDEGRGQVQRHPLAEMLDRRAEVVGHLVRPLLTAGGFVHLYIISYDISHARGIG